MNLYSNRWSNIENIETADYRENNLYGMGIQNKRLQFNFT